MPKMDGLETIGSMVKLKLEVPIIIHTAYSSYRNDYLAMVADAYVVKPPTSRSSRRRFTS